VWHFKSQKHRARPAVGLNTTANNFMSTYDKDNIGNILSGEGSWFTANLLRLISKADSNNLELIRKGFPEEVAALESYRKGE
jgi:hypothetical protein